MYVTTICTNKRTDGRIHNVVSLLHIVLYNDDYIIVNKHCSLTCYKRRNFPTLDGSAKNGNYIQYLQETILCFKLGLDFEGHRLVQEIPGCDRRHRWSQARLEVLEGKIQNGMLLLPGWRQQGYQEGGPQIVLENRVHWLGSFYRGWGKFSIQIRSPF